MPTICHCEHKLIIIHFQTKYIFFRGICRNYTFTKQMRAPASHPLGQVETRGLGIITTNEPLITKLVMRWAHKRNFETKEPNAIAVYAHNKPPALLNNNNRIYKLNAQAIFFSFYIKGV